MRIAFRVLAIAFACALLVPSGWTLAAPTPAETVLHSFRGSSDGAIPHAGLIADKEGALYGTTTAGGNGGNGTVFKLTPPFEGYGAWKETVLYRFCSQPSCSDGANPYAGLLADKEGALYGTTAGGHGGNGTVFKLTPPVGGHGSWVDGHRAWKETVLYRFCSQPSCSDGAIPYARLIADKEGALYGTTSAGGHAGKGTVFKLTPPVDGHGAWKETVLYSFCSQEGCFDGSAPYAGLIADKEGALYGTTDRNAFKLTPPAKGQTAWTLTVLNAFCHLPGCADGGGPYADLIADKEGALYGTTTGGGDSEFAGTVFKLTPPANGQGFWTETVLYSFCSVYQPDCGDGLHPYGSLIADEEGALYGTTTGSVILEGKPVGKGTVFKLTPPATGQTAWTESVLYRFCSQPRCSDGAIPYSGLIADKKGALYGTTTAGGQGGNGTVFKLALCPEGRSGNRRENGEDRDHDRDRCPVFPSDE